MEIQMSSEIPKTINNQSTSFARKMDRVTNVANFLFRRQNENRHHSSDASTNYFTKSGFVSNTPLPATTNKDYNYRDIILSSYSDGASTKLKHSFFNNGYCSMANPDALFHLKNYAGHKVNLGFAKLIRGTASHLITRKNENTTLGYLSGGF
jgi:hypothetical protein